MEPEAGIYNTDIPLGKRVIVGVIIAVLIAAISAVVHISSEVHSSAAVEFFYIPILLAAFYFEELGGILVALICAFLAMVLAPTKGPDGSPLVLAPLVRAGFFFIIGGLASRISFLLRQRTREFATLYHVANHVASSLRLEDVLHRIAEEARSVMQVKGCSIRLLPQENGNGEEFLPSYAQTGLSDHYFEKDPGDLERSPINKAALEGKVAYVEDARVDESFLHHDLAREEGIVSVLAVPLISRERTVGVIKVYSSKKRRFLPSEIALLTAFAKQAAIAIENAVLHENVRAGYYDTVRALSLAIEAKDPEAMGHTNRVLKWMMQFARRLGLPPEELELIKFGTILHDVGKIGISENDDLAIADSTLREEYTNTMHALIGASILAPVHFLQPVLPMVRSHHERLDGSGFPEHLTGENLDKHTRMLCIVDQFDIWVNGMEGETYSVQRALAELARAAGTKFDAELVSIFRELVKEELGIHDKLESASSSPGAESGTG